MRVAVTSRHLLHYFLPHFASGKRGKQSVFGGTDRVPGSARICQDMHITLWAASWLAFFLFYLFCLPYILAALLNEQREHKIS